MRTFKLIDGDVTFDINNDIAFISDDDEVAQALERAFTTNSGEWFLNANHGLEYSEIQGKKGLSKERVQTAILKTALQEPRVKEVISIDIEKDTASRTLDIKFACRLISGNIVEVPINI